MNTNRRNWTYTAAVVIVYGFLTAAAAGSFMHIVETAHKLGLDWQAWTVPFLIDGVALMGKLGRSRRFATRTQRAGLSLILFGGTLSLAANVYAGDNTGQRAYGVLLVLGFVLVEWYAGQLAPAEADPQPEVNAEAAIQARIDAEVAAALVKAERSRKAKERRDAKRLAELVPVSPATVAEIDGSLAAPVSSYEPAYL